MKMKIAIYDTGKVKKLEANLAAKMWIGDSFENWKFIYFENSLWGILIKFLFMEINIFCFLSFRRLAVELDIQ